MTINSNSVEQINVALLDIYKKLKILQSGVSDTDKKQNILNTETFNNKIVNGETYNINISGKAANAAYATDAGNATVANVARTADRATVADRAVNADYATDAGNATTATTANTAGLAETVDMEWLLNAIYPVNSVYISGVDTDPSTLFGGTWEAIFISDEVFSWKRTA